MKNEERLIVIVISVIVAATVIALFLLSGAEITDVVIHKGINLG